MMTLLATLLMGGTMFQRRAKTGWLDELDEIRGGALMLPDHEMASAMDPPSGGPAPDDDDDGSAPNHRWMQRVREASAQAVAEGRSTPFHDVAADLLRATWDLPVAVVEPEPKPAVRAEPEPEAVVATSKVTASDDAPPSDFEAQPDTSPDLSERQDGPGDGWDLAAEEVVAANADSWNTADLAGTDGRLISTDDAGPPAVPCWTRRRTPVDRWRCGIPATSADRPGRSPSSVRRNESNRAPWIFRLRRIGATDGSPVSTPSTGQIRRSGSPAEPPEIPASTAPVEPPLLPLAVDPAAGGPLRGPVGRRRRSETMGVRPPPRRPVKAPGPVEAVPPSPAPVAVPAFDAVKGVTSSEGSAAVAFVEPVDVLQAEAAEGPDHASEAGVSADPAEAEAPSDAPGGRGADRPYRRGRAGRDPQR